MKRLSIFSFLLMFCAFLWAQTPDRNSVIIHSTDWVQFQEANGVQQLYRFADCNSTESGFIGEYVQIRIVNTTNQAKTVEWDMKLWYNNECINCTDNNDEFKRIISIPANGVIESNCFHNGYSNLNIYSASLKRMPDEWELTHFEFRNFTVK